jgi:hypothetical protein
MKILRNGINSQIVALPILKGWRWYLEIQFAESYYLRRCRKSLAFDRHNYVDISGDIAVMGSQRSMK